MPTSTPGKLVPVPRNRFTTARQLNILRMNLGNKDWLLKGSTNANSKFEHPGGQ